MFVVLYAQLHTNALTLVNVYNIFDVITIFDIDKSILPSFLRSTELFKAISHISGSEKWSKRMATHTGRTHTGRTNGQTERHGGVRSKITYYWTKRDAQRIA